MPGRVLPTAPGQQRLGEGGRSHGKTSHLSVLTSRLGHGEGEWHYHWPSVGGGRFCGLLEPSPADLEPSFS